jgi:hypothetical protein
MKVTLILDPAYGERLDRLDLPVWVCESPGNRLAAERRWASPGFDPRSVTVFKTVGESHDETCADIIRTIDEHHPEWTEITVVGAVATPGTRACFANFEPGDVVESEGGFTYLRSARS